LKNILGASGRPIITAWAAGGAGAGGNANTNVPVGDSAAATSAVVDGENVETGPKRETKGKGK